MSLPFAGTAQAVQSFAMGGLVSVDICIYLPSNLVESKEGKLIFIRNLLLIMAIADI